MRASRVAFIVSLAVLASCGSGYKFGHGYGMRVNTQRSRITPEVKRLPDGVGSGRAMTATFPAGTSLPRMLGFYLDVARGRGALWVSGLRAVYGDCQQALLPAFARRDQDVTYLDNDQYWGGANDTTLTTRKEHVSVPYLRLIDDRAGIAESVAIWVTNHPGRCDTSSVVRIEADLHGRADIGVMKGARDLDYRHCGGAPAPTAPAPRQTLALGDLAALDTADRVLPGWLKARVRIVYGDHAAEGTFTGYRARTLSITEDDGTRIDVHALDALAIERVDAPAPAPAETPSAASDAPLECPAGLRAPIENTF